MRALGWLGVLRSPLCPLHRLSYRSVFTPRQKQKLSFTIWTLLSVLTGREQPALGTVREINRTRLVQCCVSFVHPSLSVGHIHVPLTGLKAPLGTSHNGCREQQRIRTFAQNMDASQ